jgi:signal transduction histidine kinase
MSDNAPSYPSRARTDDLAPAASVRWVAPWLEPLLADLRDAAAVVDARTGRVVAWNPAAEALMGVSAEAAIGRPLGESLGVPLPDVDWAAPGGCSRDIVGAAPRRHLELSVSPLSGLELAGPLSLVLIRGGGPHGLPRLTDVLTKLLHELPGGVVLFDRDWRYEMVNAAYAAYFGLTPEHFVGRSLTDVFPDVVHQLGWPVASEPTTYKGVGERFVYHDADGAHETYWDYVVSPLCGATDEVPHHLVVAFEVSERVRARKRLEKQAGELAQRDAQGRVLQALAHIGYWEWDVTTGDLDLSDECFRILGLEPGEMHFTMALFMAHVHPDDRHLIAQIMEAAHDVERPIEVTYRIVRPNGEVRHLHGVGIHLEQDGAGGVTTRCGIMQDVTEKQIMDRAKDEFLSVVSHELRTPLTAIRAPLLMFASGKLSLDSPVGAGLLELAVNNVERMTRLVNDIFDMERLATGKLSIRPVAGDALTLALQAAAAMAETADTAGVRVTVSGEPLPVLADADRLIQVLTNLLDNAIAFSPSGSEVTLAVTRRGEEAWLSVKDRGPGVPEADQATIFERFHQLEPSSTRTKQGLGLGLAIGRGIVEQHGGRMSVESRPGEGATFHVVLPIRR